MSTLPAHQQHRIWCGDQTHNPADPCEISHTRERATVVMHQAAHELQPALTVVVQGTAWPLNVDVGAAQDVVLTLTLALEHLARIGEREPAH